MKLKSALLGLLLAVPAAAVAKESPDHLYWFAAAEDGAPRPWAVILPGGGGIDNFGDEGEYYFAFARWLNSHGIDALVVHYQRDARPLDEVGLPAYGEEIAGAALRGIESERSLGRMDVRCDGIVFGWSMGGQGVWELAGNESVGLAAAIAFYPSVQSRGAGYTPRIPVTLLQGESDTFTPLPALQEFVGGSTVPEAFSLHLFEGARHGFDVDTVAEPQLGGGFAYDRQSAEAAHSVLEQELAESDLSCGLD